MAYDFHLAPANGNAQSGNLTSFYEVSLETDEKDKAYLLITYKSGPTRPIGTWSTKEYQLLQEQLGFSLKSIPIYWKNGEGKENPINDDLSHL
ncbi:hypothetical protein NF418_07205 [Streptococcus suis]|uniref:hypothetical protein n=1 Tax=Streptococcus suis TaxID=1307 RepID=UPI00211749EA|nr:hypothetical protein [Streptococcus suis]